MLRPARALKLLGLQAARALGGFRLVERSNWRRQRLLILCYHGISLRDEHLWDGDMYMSPERFEERCRSIRRRGLPVLPLGEAARALRAGELTEPAVAITFDDGFYDFYRVAAPILRAHDLPATLYLTTFYVDFPRPLFNLVVPYMFWRTDHSLGTWPAEALLIVRSADEQGLSAAEKDEVARRTADKLGVDYDELSRSRILQLVTPAEAGELAQQGFDIQLHTHRHRTPDDEALFRREIRDNRERIEALTGRTPTHFCYPSGVHSPAFLPWLESEGVETATVCDPGLASPSSPPLLLPRKIDTMGVTDLELHAWLSGFEPRLRGLSS